MNSKTIGTSLKAEHSGGFHSLTTIVLCLLSYRLRKRKEFEDRIRMNRKVMGIWMRYAAFEEQQGDFRRCRSVYERSLLEDSQNVTIWLRYADMEMRNRYINHARNVWDRAVSLLPRVDQLWFAPAHFLLA
jgi:crooked neck